MDEMREAAGLLSKLAFPQFPFTFPPKEEAGVGLWRLEEEFGKYWGAGKEYLIGTTVPI